MKPIRSTQRQLPTKAQNRTARENYLQESRSQATKPPAGEDQGMTQLAKRLLQKLGLTNMAKKATVSWNYRLQTTAGNACVRTGSINLNPRLAKFGSEQINRTLRHEVAHLAAHARAGRHGMSLQTHGPEWQQACADLGIRGEPAFHDLPFRRRRVDPKFFYQCPCCATVVKRVRKFERCTACYRCCKTYSYGRYDPRFKFLRISLV